MWKTQHVIIDDFLEADHFNTLSKINHGEIKPKGRKAFINSVMNGKTVAVSQIPEDVLLDIDRRYTPGLLKTLDNLAPGLSKTYTYTELTIIATGKDYSFKIHSDVKCKILSVVVYLMPERNSGTLLYNSKIDDIHGTDEMEVEWKQNRYTIFYI